MSYFVDLPYHIRQGNYFGMCISSGQYQMQLFPPFIENTEHLLKINQLELQGIVKLIENLQLKQP